MKQFFMIFLLVFIPGMILGVSWGNGSPIAFNSSTTIIPSNGLKCSTGSQSPLDSLVVEGAVYFLKSNSDFILVLQRYEQNMSDFEGIQDALNSAITNMKGAHSTYEEIKNLAFQTPYNPSVIFQLTFFDYSGFRKSKGLFSDVFLKVSTYLMKGDVTGTYVEIFNKTGELLNKLNAVKSDLDNGIIPDVSKLWDINQKYTYALLFGQYESMVFKTIK